MNVTSVWRAAFVVHLLLALALMLVALRVDAQDADRSALVVASPKLQGYYRGAVILAAPFKDAHVGVILNRPSRYKLSQLFPDHAPSAAVTDPVYFGGPAQPQVMTALVRSETSPHQASIELAPKIWLVFDAGAVDAIIEATPNAARYFAGVVAWERGELLEELRAGEFLLMPVDPAKLFLPDTSKLYEDLAPKPRARRVES